MRIDLYHEVKNYAVFKNSITPQDDLSEEQIQRAYIAHLHGKIFNYYFVLSFEDETSLGRNEQLEEILKLSREFTARDSEELSIPECHSYLDQICLAYENLYNFLNN